MREPLQRCVGRCFPQALQLGPLLTPASPQCTREVAATPEEVSAASTWEQLSRPDLCSWHIWRAVSEVWWPGEGGWSTFLCYFLYKCREQQEWGCSVSRDKPGAEGYPSSGRALSAAPRGLKAAAELEGITQNYSGIGSNKKPSPRRLCLNCGTHHH